MPIRLALIGAAGGALLVAAGWLAWDWHGAARYDAGYQMAIKDAKAQADAQALASASRLAALEHTHAEIRRLENEKESALAAAVDTGRVRLHINATCPSLPKTADAGVGDGAGAILNPAARQDYFSHRGRVIENERRLTMCLDSVRELTTSSTP